ncbi:MAG TPA: hypothetical protein VGK00_05295 [Anaerolineales bacterium]
MKIASKLVVFILMMTLLFLPLHTVQARSLADGPIFGSNFTLKSGETLNEDLVVFGGSILIEKDAKVNGSVVLLGGSLTLDGEVTKDVVVVGGSSKLGADTHVHGNLVTFGATLIRDTGARVDGDVINNTDRPVLPTTPGVTSVPQSQANPLWQGFLVLFQSIMLALLATLIAMFLPNHMRRVADAIVTQPFAAFGMGLLTLVMFIVAIVALALFSLFIITLFVTIPLIVIISIVFAAATVLGWLALGMEVGVRIAELFKSEWALPLAAGVGVFILNLVAQSVSFIPCIGGLLSGILGFAGLGAVFMTRFGIRPSIFTTPTVLEAVPPTQPG